MAKPAPPSTTPPAASAEPRYAVLLVITILATVIGGLVTAVTVGALLSFLPAVVGVVLGAVVGFGLPLFLALRAAAALKRRKRGVLVRRLAVLTLVVAAQLAITGAILQYSPRTTGSLAFTAWDALDVVGGVPVVSDLLYAHAEREGAIPGTVAKGNHGKPKVGLDGGVLLGPDGGVARTADGGIASPAHGADAHGADGGVAHVDAADAGSAAVTNTEAPGPAPPRPKPGVGLSPRAEGKAARTFAAGVQTNTGDSLIIVGTVSAGGAFTSRIVDLSSNEKLGDPTIIECADDGSVAAVLGGAHLVTAGAGKGTAQVVKSLEPGQRLGGLEIQAVRDVVVGPGGAGLAIVDLLAGANGELSQALVTLPKGAAAAAVLRKTGDKVPGSATDATIAKSWSFKKSSGAGTVLVDESYLEGGDDVGTRMSGETYLLNPQRLLVVKLDAPKAQVELVRTGTEPSGNDGKEMQVFGDAWLLADGRAVLDANFIEKGADGWLFVVKPGGGIFALSPDLADKAPWGTTAPRMKYLEAGADGTLVFRRDDGAAVVTSIDAPATQTAALLSADALASDGRKLGSVASVDVPLLARGGEWLIAKVSMKGATAHDAIVLASRADVQNGKAEVLVEVGAKVPEAAAKGKAKEAKERLVQSIRLLKGRDELLWQR